MEMWGPTVWSTLQPWSHGKCSSSDSSPERETLSSSRFGLFKMQANQSCTPGRILWVCGLLLSQRGSHCFHEEDGSLLEHRRTPKVWAACRMCVMDFGAKTGLLVVESTTPSCFSLIKFSLSLSLARRGERSRLGFFFCWRRQCI